MGGRHGFKFRQSPGNCVHAGAGSYIEQKLSMRRSGVLWSKPGAATSKNWSRDLTIDHQNPWQDKHKTDRTLHRIPQGENRLQKNMVRSHHKRMCAATMLTLKNLCNIYEFDFIWSILKKPFNVMRNILDDCNDMFAALRATAVPRQLISLDITGFWAAYCIFQELIYYVFFSYSLYIKHGRKNSLYFPP